jgi:HEPN domain-containing protein
MPTDVQRARDLLTLAEHDLKACEVVVREGASLNVAAFLAQQTAEKALKAVLALHGIDYPRTHDIQALLSLLEPVEPEVERFADATEDLLAYGVSVRYDIELYPTADQVAQALETASRVLSWASQLVTAQ